MRAVLVLNSFFFVLNAKKANLEQKEQIWSKSYSNGVKKKVSKHPHGLDISHFEILAIPTPNI